GMDPCGVLQTPVELRANETVEIVFFLGEVPTRAEARILIARYRAIGLDEVFRSVTKSWDDVFDVVKVKTPDRSFDILVNYWALYQTLACRVWARSAFYQSSGAYGFRDQIQDTMALALVKPELTRAHVLRAASRQFVEGDFQHWWLPPAGQGVRTKISDDKVWLPYAVINYLQVTNDTPVLDEKVLYIEGQHLRPDEHDAFFQPMVSEESATLYEHCALALDKSLALGVHGLPLMGTGDWNDGMNRVGEGGKGESVWLAWFLYTTLAAFIPIAKSRRDTARAKVWEKHIAALQKSLEREAWDGQWYRRAFYDDGTPLGSSLSDECWIDSIAQSWAVISGAAKIERQIKSMESVEELLVRRDEKLIQLFTPPFDETQLNPGYIKGYPPGVRENGGQYTHAAIWTVIATAMLGDGDRASELYSMLNPITHSNSRAAIRKYKVEPYVVAADVYSQPPHVGRGGWTWYTGSAGWMYRAGLEWILGFRVRGTTLIIDPCIPKKWAGFEIVFRYKSARYEIAVSNSGYLNRGVSRVELDGRVLESTEIPLADDGTTHRVRITLTSLQG
ncbi:MAG: glycosyl hydrolase family 65 protein, partial [bacterium]